MTRELCAILHADLAFIGELDEAHETITTVSMFADGADSPDITYTLRATPCDEVIGKRCCVYTDGVAELFPGDEMLRELGIRGYVGVPVWDARERPIGIIVALYHGPVEDEAFATDAITLFAGRVGAELDRRRATRRAAAAEARALQEQKLESLSALAGGLAHDLNNTLATITGNAELALRDMPADQRADHLDTIIRAADSASALCRQLLAYAGKSRPTNEAHDLSCLITRERDALTRSTDLATLELDLAPAVTRVDPGQLWQLLHGLVRNAAEATASRGADGHITVHTDTRMCSADDLRSPYLHPPPRPGMYACLEVRDNGVGMSREVMQRLFDPFFTTRFKGRGLGLSMILGVVRSHGGTLHVESVEGVGATFRLLFPEAQRTPAAILPPRKTSPAPSPEAKSILLVEDNEALRAVHGKTLRVLGHQVIEASDGLHALELLHAHQPEIGLVIMDLIMPRMGGLDAFLAMRDTQPNLPVILTSGYAEESLVLDELETPPNAFLHKPFRLRELVRCIGTAMQRGSARP